MHEHPSSTRPQTQALIDNLHTLPRIKSTKEHPGSTRQALNSYGTTHLTLPLVQASTRNQEVEIQHAVQPKAEPIWLHCLFY
ncbi:MAG: hypothetical protein KDB07_03555, partial [Planctomycetes bacterium]|nr:hypothetical protein [Planctomycetota bacterium]